jgi:hypothetical protein
MVITSALNESQTMQTFSFQRHATLTFEGFPVFYIAFAISIFLNHVVMRKGDERSLATK